MSTPRETLNGQRRPGFRPDLPPGGRRRRLTLTGRGRPVAASRDFARAALADWAWPGVDDVLLLVTELVTNAVLHGDGPLDLVLDADAHRLRVEVDDASPVLPIPREPHLPARPGGHGLFVVARTCDRWGAVPRPWGKTVWAETDTRPPTAGS
ncbi:ATP-binding protein [Kitasatospora sp. NPDC096147]|uniref:ATP-binding protein n=1 Tax=Kitasatospora sp. NPDC096147 TaxID=3364093 RepID=UPI003818AD4F